MEQEIEVAKVTSKGQITIPADIRRQMNIKTGDEIFFVVENGRVVMLGQNSLAIRKFADAMVGEAERVGWSSPKDVDNYIMELRAKNVKKGQGVK
ncbi:MAG: AbrB/MazE/SpoVT family DNA-binding domain-containing protein [Firmicutes bacterium]|nr:AbrB/MazE/SpoVT family DNA-binding domain-containing protein [Bacillota bacterium]